MPDPRKCTAYAEFGETINKSRRRMRCYIYTI